MSMEHTKSASLYGAPDAAHITESTLILGGIVADRTTMMGYM